MWREDHAAPHGHESSTRFERSTAGSVSSEPAVGSRAMNERNRRCFIGLITLLLASCGPIQSGQVQDQINGMIGLAKEHVLSCMGPPTSTANAGATEVWSYNSLGPINTSAIVSGNQSLVVGSTSTSQEFCVVNLTMQNTESSQRILVLKENCSLQTCLLCGATRLCA